MFPMDRCAWICNHFPIQWIIDWHFPHWPTQNNCELSSIMGDTVKCFFSEFCIWGFRLHISPYNQSSSYRYFSSVCWQVKQQVASCLPSFFLVTNQLWQNRDLFLQTLAIKLSFVIWPRESQSITKLGFNPDSFLLYSIWPFSLKVEPWWGVVHFQCCLIHFNRGKKCTPFMHTTSVTFGRL